MSENAQEENNIPVELPFKHKFTELPTVELSPYLGNTRDHSEEQVQKVVRSMRKFGFTNPIVVDEDNLIIAGHCRLMAAQHLNLVNCPVMIAQGWSDIEKKAYGIADNRLALDASWNMENLIADMREIIESEEFDAEETGFDQNEIDEFMDDSDTEDFDEEDEINESANFIIKCEDLSDLHQLKMELGVETDKISSGKFFEIINNRNGS
ncbi:MAG: ParB/Srx family N-terminal domain-containing protein [Promethearchaeota archaeon]